MRHFLTVDDLDPAGLAELLDLADDLRSDRAARAASASTMVRSELHAKTVALLFEKPSLRTRASFEVGVAELGGHPMPMFDFEVGLGRRESIADTARVLSRYVHGIVLRTFGQERIEELAANATVPVINALSDHEHPCQAVADLLTVRGALGGLDGAVLAYVGDGNNVAHSLLLAGALAGMEIRVVHPEGYGPDPAVVARASEIDEQTGGTTVTTTDPVAGVEGADAVYTDVWASMGQEEEADERAARFAGFQVTPELMGHASPEAIFLHCLPAHRGEEVAAAVIDGPASRVFDQAENRLHAQKALLVTLLGEVIPTP